jgi:hypothetical protein
MQSFMVLKQVVHMATNLKGYTDYLLNKYSISFNKRNPKKYIFVRGGLESYKQYLEVHNDYTTL